jgi:predicted phosphohydrolase
MRRHCEQLIEPDDILLIPGDISWAMKRKDAEPDLAYVAALPGIKVLCKGNHDYWWDSDKPLSYPGLLDTPYSLSNKELGVAGTRGWFPINGQMTSEEMASNASVIAREVKRLTKRLSALEGCATKMVMTHYPPLEEFREVLTDHGVSTILYGHLHLGGSDRPPPEDWHGMRQICVASDRINFTPKLIKAL